MFHWPTRVTWAWPNCKRGNEYGVELSAVSTTPRDQRSIPGSCVKGHTRLGRFLTWNCRNGAKNLPSQHDSSYPSQILPGLLDFFFFLIALIWHSLKYHYTSFHLLRKIPTKTITVFLKRSKKNVLARTKSKRINKILNCMSKKLYKVVHKTRAYKSLRYSKNTELRSPKFYLPISINKILMK